MNHPPSTLPTLRPYHSECDPDDACNGHGGNEILTVHPELVREDVAQVIQFVDRVIDQDSFLQAQAPRKSEILLELPLGRRRRRTHRHRFLSHSRLLLAHRQ